MSIMSFEMNDMAFEIVNETYTTQPGENPKKWGYIEGYTSNTIGKIYLRLNIKSIPEQDQYDTYAQTGALKYFEYRVGEVYGEGIRLSRRQVFQLMWELAKWLIKGR